MGSLVDIFRVFEREQRVVLFKMRGEIPRGKGFTAFLLSLYFSSMWFAFFLLLFFSYFFLLRDVYNDIPRAHGTAITAFSI